MAIVVQSEKYKSTTFEGPDVAYLINDDGSLSIYDWIIDNKTGHTVFASGSWTVVTKSCLIKV